MAEICVETGRRRADRPRAHSPEKSAVPLGIDRKIHACRRKPPQASFPNLRPSAPEAVCEVQARANQTVRRTEPIDANAEPDYLPVHRPEFLHRSAQMRRSTVPPGCAWHSSRAPHTDDCDQETNARAASRGYRVRDPRDHQLAVRDG